MSYHATAQDTDRVVPGTGIDPAAFRAAMGMLASSVHVVTTMDERHRPRGFTCTSLCSVSLAPPRLLVCAGATSRTLRAIRASGSFAVNALHAGGDEAAALFSSAVPDKFACVSWRRGPVLGLPWLSGDCAVLLECSVVDSHPAGDHDILIGLVRSAVPAQAPAPLIRLAGAYTSPRPLDAEKR